MDIQFTSDDGTVKEGDIMYEWSKVFIGAGEMMGRTFTIARNSKQLLEEAGFVDVVKKAYKIPVGTWMEDPKWKEIGRWDLLYLTTGLEGMALYILKNVLGVSIPCLTDLGKKLIYNLGSGSSCKFRYIWLQCGKLF